MREVSIRRSAIIRLAALYSGLYGLSFLVLLGIVLWSSIHSIRIQDRESVEQDSRALSQIFDQAGRAALEANLRTLISSVEKKRALYQLEDTNGRVIVGNFDSISPIDGWQFLSVPLGTKRNARYLAYGRRVGEQYLIIGRRTHSLWRSQGTLLGTFAWAFGIVVPITLLGGFLLARRAFQRVDAIDSVMSRYVQGEFSRRVPVSGRGDEIDRLATDINRVLDQLEKLFATMKQITTDIAHDLKTPLGRLSQRLGDAVDVERKGGNLQPILDQSLQDVEGIIATFDALLQIAELDAGSRSARLKPVKLAEVATSIHEIYESVADDHGHRLLLHVTDDPVIRGDPRLLTQLLANLVENAIRHTPTGTVIELVVARVGDNPTVTVSDNGPGVPLEQQDLVFQRFYRLDASRTTLGSGLGLTLVKAIADLHGATVRLSQNDPGLAVVVEFQ